MCWGLLLLPGGVAEPETIQAAAATAVCIQGAGATADRVGPIQDYRRASLLPQRENKPHGTAGLLICDMPMLEEAE